MEKKKLDAKDFIKTLGLNNCPSKEIIEIVKEAFFSTIVREDTTKEKCNKAIDNLENIINQFKDAEAKGAIIAILLAQLPFDIQLTIIEEHKKFISVAMMYNTSNKIINKLYNTVEDE